MYIGIDIGGTNIKAVALKPDGREILRDITPTGDASDAYRSTVLDIVTRIEQVHGPARALGVSSPGLASPDGRKIVWMMGRMAGVMGFDWTTHLKRSEPVRVLNDAHAALLGEVRAGAARGRRDVVMLTLGTGVGGAIMSEGRLLKGHLGRAGHLGHISLDPAGTLDIVRTPGSLEDAIGDHTIAQRTRGRYASTKRLVESIDDDPLARTVWEASVRSLAAGMVSIINAVDPEVFVLGGGIVAAGDALLIPLREQLDRLEWCPTGQRVSIVRATLGDYAGAVGAAFNAKENT
jgi:glucokinase